MMTGGGPWRSECKPVSRRTTRSTWLDSTAKAGRRPPHPVHGGDCVTVAAKSRAVEAALARWKDLQFYDPTSAVASSLITVLPKPKVLTPVAGGASPDHRSGT
jgi:hypothetical protein